MPNYRTITNYSYIQTFYADPAKAGNSSTVDISNVILYFKTKSTTSGVTVLICDVENDQPVLSKVYADAQGRKLGSDATFGANPYQPINGGAIIYFNTPLRVQTGKWYGIVVIFDGPGFSLWTNKVGDPWIGFDPAAPNTVRYYDPSTGAWEPGKLYRGSNAGSMTAINDEDLMYILDIKKYTSNTASVVYTNPNYEFLTISNRTTTRFLSGEYIYKLSANATGNVAFTEGTTQIVGNGTTFTSYTVGTPIVIYGNTTHTQVVKIASIANNTSMTVATPIPYSNTQTKYAVPVVGKVYYQDDINNKLYLTDSTANTSNKLAVGDTLIGEDSRANCTIASIDNYSIDRFRLFADANTPPAGSINLKIGATVFNGSSYVYDASKLNDIVINNTRVTDISDYDAYVLSRSLEVDNASLYSNAELGITRKSLVVAGDLQINQTTADLYSAPAISTGAIDLFTIQNKVANTYTAVDANGITVDTEVTNNGTALSKHISKKVTFANNRYAEDVKVFMTAYRPVGTDLKVYAKVHNSQDPESFVEKAWSPLVYDENGSRYSSSEDTGDFIEYELSFPQHSEVANVVPGTFTTQLSNNIVVAQGVTANSYISNNDVIKLYSPLFANTNYIIAPVVASNSTTITLGSPIANNGVVGSGMKIDKLKYYNTAFNNITNDNVARYYNSSLVEFDKFDSMQIKVVMLSDTTYQVPKIDQIQVIGVSA